MRPSTILTEWPPGTRVVVERDGDDHAGDRFDLSAVVAQTYGPLPVPTAAEKIELLLLMRGVVG